MYITSKSYDRSFFQVSFWNTLPLGKGVDKMEEMQYQRPLIYPVTDGNFNRKQITPGPC